MGWTGRGGMFLAPAGNPSSLRVGHPDVATEHTASPLPLSPSLWCEVGCGCALGNEPRDARLGKSVRGGGEGILRLGTADSSPGNEGWQPSMAVVL